MQSIFHPYLPLVFSVAKSGLFTRVGINFPPNTLYKGQNMVLACIFAEKSEKFAGKRPVHGCTSRDSGVYYNFLALADRREA